MALFELPKPVYATETQSPKVKPVCVQAQQTIADCFGELKPNTCYPYATGAMWSTHDLLAYILDQIGPATLHVATWSMSNNAADLVLHWIQEGILLDMTCVFDWRVRVRTPNLIPLLGHNNCKLRVTSCHAKAFVLQNEDWAVSLVGSANLTNNPRIEAGHLSTQPEISKFHANWITMEAQNGKPFGEEVGRRKKDGSNSL